MTRDELESVLWRAGLTLTQVQDVLTAADRYAKTQCDLAIGAAVTKAAAS